MYQSINSTKAFIMKFFKKYSFVLVLLFIGYNAKSQINFDSFLEAGTADAGRLFEQYMEPAFVGFGFGLNSGWYNTAKVHKPLGIDLTVTVSMARVPSSAEFFTFRNSDYSNVRIEGVNEAQLPTVFGPNLPGNELPLLTFLDPDSGNPVINISAPTGAGIEEETIMPFNAVPVPMAQVGLGLFKGTELKLRYIPQTTFEDDASIGLFGIGVMHDIKQYLPGKKLLPFDLSVFAGYTSMESEIFIDNDAGQTALFDASAWTLQAVVSKKLALLTLFGGVGYTNYDVDFKLLGTYTTQLLSFTDPVDINFADNGFRANAGVRIKLLFLTITGEYAMQEYNTITAGVGVSIR